MFVPTQYCAYYRLVAPGCLRIIGVVGKYMTLAMLDRIISFLRGEAVLCIAFLCAAVSFAFAPFDAAQVAASIDVLVLLFCLMAAVVGLAVI